MHDTERMQVRDPWELWLAWFLGAFAIGLTGSLLWLSWHTWQHGWGLLSWLGGLVWVGLWWTVVGIAAIAATVALICGPLALGLWIMRKIASL